MPHIPPHSIRKKIDAIVVGAGISGRWSAKELNEKDLNVLLPERGRMIEHVSDGTSPDNSVFNKFNQPHIVKNVFCTDGGSMPSSSCQNPSLTYMALSARAAGYAVKALKRGDLKR